MWGTSKCHVLAGDSYWILVILLILFLLLSAQKYFVFLRITKRFSGDRAFISDYLHGPRNKAACHVSGPHKP